MTQFPYPLVLLLLFEEAAAEQFAGLFFDPSGVLFLGTVPLSFYVRHRIQFFLEFRLAE